MHGMQRHLAGRWRDRPGGGQGREQLVGEVLAKEQLGVGLSFDRKETSFG